MTMYLFATHTYHQTSPKCSLRRILTFFEQIEIDIVKYNDMGKVYVSGDLNSRTSDSFDYFDFDKYLDEPFV